MLNRKKHKHFKFFFFLKYFFYTFNVLVSEPERYLPGQPLPFLRGQTIFSFLWDSQRVCIWVCARVFPSPLLLKLCLFFSHCSFPLVAPN